MRIAIIAAWTSSNHVGGVENHIKYLRSELSREHDVVVFSSNRKQSISAMDVSVLGLITGLAGKISLNWSQLRNLRDILRFRPDVVHQHDFTSSILLVLALRLMGYEVILTNHTGEYLYLRRILGRPLDWIIGAIYKHCIAPSTELRPRIERSTVIYNGYDQATFRPRARDQITAEDTLAAQLPIARFEAVLLVPRRWAPTKGVVYALKAAEQLPEVAFLFAGSDYDNYPEYRRQCMSIAEANVSNNIFLLGDVEASEMAGLINLSHGVLLPSLVEAVSLSAIEANACGRPVFASDAPGNLEFVKDGKNGFIFQRRSADSLATCIRQNLRACIAGALSTSCIEAARAHTWAAVAERTKSVFSATKKSLGSLSPSTLPSE